MKYSDKDISWYMEIRVRRRIYLGTWRSGFGEGYILVHGDQGSEKDISWKTECRVRRRTQLDRLSTGFGEVYI